MEASYHRKGREIDRLHFSKQNIRLYEKIIYSQNSVSLLHNDKILKAKWPKTSKNMIISTILNNKMDNNYSFNPKTQAAALLNEQLDFDTSS